MRYFQANEGSGGGTATLPPASASGGIPTGLDKGSWNGVTPSSATPTGSSYGTEADPTATRTQSDTDAPDPGQTSEGDSSTGIDYDADIEQGRQYSGDDVSKIVEKRLAREAASRDADLKRLEQLSPYEEAFHTLREMGYEDGSAVVKNLQEARLAQEHASVDQQLGKDLQQLRDDVANGLKSTEEAQALYQAKQILADAQKSQKAQALQNRIAAVQSVVKDLPGIAKADGGYLKRLLEDTSPDISTRVGKALREYTTSVEDAAIAKYVAGLEDKQKTRPQANGNTDRRAVVAAPSNGNYPGSWGNLLRKK